MTPLLQSDPDEAVLDPDEGEVRRGVIENPSKPGYLVEIGSSPESALGDVGVSARDGVTIVTPVETLSDPLPPPLIERLQRLVAKGPVIVDLSGISLASAAPVVGLAGRVLSASQEPGRCCLVCGNAAARALLQESRITQCLAVFGSVGDALQARRFAREGYGTGWRPDIGGRPAT